MIYTIQFATVALTEIKDLKRSEPQAYKKLVKLLEELLEHPYSGTGKPERLKYYPEPTWSRRISQKHRLVYQVKEETVTVLVLSAFGHYDDK